MNEEVIELIAAMYDETEFLDLVDGDMVDLVSRFSDKVYENLDRFDNEIRSRLRGWDD